MRRHLAMFLLGFCASGCASNPPCKVSVAEVDAARAHTKALEAKVEMAEEERERLARELDEKEATQQEGEDASKEEGAR